MKIKKIKSTGLVSFIITIVLLLSTFSSFLSIAEAADVAPETGNLYIHKYYMADSDLANIPNNGEAIPVHELPDSAVPLEGITFDLFKVVPIEGTYPQGKSLIVDEQALTVTDEGVTYDLVKSSSIISDSDGTAFLPNLPQGAYIVVERSTEFIEIAGEKITLNPIAPFIVHVPMTNPSGSDWLTDVHVYPKNEGLASEKIAQTSLANRIGGTMSYRMNTKVPAGIYDSNPTIDENITFSLIDTLDTALTLQTDSLKVYTSDTKEGEMLPGTEMLLGQDYILNTASNFSVDFTAAGRQKLSNNKFVILAFDVEVNQSLGTDDRMVVGNKASVNFVNKNGQTVTVETSSVDIHTAAIQIEKLSARDNKKLKDAEFQLASSQKNAKEGNYLRRDEEGRIIDFGENGYDLASAWMVKTDENGFAEFKGIEDYRSTIDAQGGETITDYLSYWLVETKAPTGYHLLDDAVQVSFDQVSSSGDSPTFTIKSQIKNSKKGLLPKTGSTAALIFSVVGIVIIGVGIIFGIFSNKKKKIS
ncbi:SpaH/EbpB family LPXTG-anchored major pilin [Vagococcus elongatus]|uniref:Gram-positive cocci surface proteins LPxTG domain-containing protein n=1 Tax=Vagococcus elongatus TaxID=180344 RepID=A0A430B5E5_9ENTE|nr:SpaH/EbpB family LPXTG-anchored major pilin [Vagococcus elongatus]RSU15533.1 hypothetical protein CBF29_00195 [Vagococcus elongatus]